MQGLVDGGQLAPLWVVGRGLLVKNRSDLLLLHQTECQTLHQVFTMSKWKSRAGEKPPPKTSDLSRAGKFQPTCICPLDRGWTEYHAAPSCD